MKAALRELIQGVKDLPRTGHAAVALGVLGLVLMLPFEAWFTRLFGVLALFGFVALGVWTIADPRGLAAADDANPAQNEP